MKVLKAFGLAAGGALAAVAAVKILRNAQCKKALLGAFNRTAVRVDQKMGWSTLPVPAALAVLAGDRNTLRENNLIDTNTPGVVPGPLPAYPNVVTARTPDGTFNDLKCPFMGSAGSRFGRNVPLNETWQEKQPELMTPSPRVVSLELMTRNEFTPAKTLNLLAAAWLQFQIRDWFSHGSSIKEDAWQVPLGEGDTWHENPMQILRTMPDPTRTAADEGKPLTYINTETPWWDGSQLYGSTADYRAKVRTGIDGKIFVGKDHLVHPDPTALMQLQTAALVGWWVGLELFYTLFSLEHNSICDKLKQEYPEWGDDDLFEHARLINAAIIAKIHTVEWTTAILGHPVLQIAMRANWWGLAGERINQLFGRLSGSELVSGIPGSETDHFGVPYSLTEEFVAVYRMHPLIPDDITFWSRETGDVLQKLNFQQIAGDDAQNICDSVHIEDLFYSFGLMNPGAVVLHNYPKTLQHFVRPDGILMDVAAHDIMRCRELGVPRYTKFRKLLNMRPVTTFEELTPNAEWREEIRRVYNNDIDTVDLIVGLFAEKPPEGFGFSDTAFRIFILMASRRLNSDRFFTTDFTEDVYSKAGMDWISDSTFSTVLLRHYPSLAPALEGVKNGFAPWKAKGAQT
jgi:hypothetical protein